MRAFVPGYEMVSPLGLTDVLSRLQKEPGKWRPFAGGTDLMVVMEAGKLDHRHFINIWNLSELKWTGEAADSLTLGALTTYAEILRHPILKEEFPMLCQAARETGAVAIQSRGTLGGNIVNASPAADSPPALLAYDAELELISTSGSRWIPYREFHLGYKVTAMRSDELLARVRLPRKTAGCRQYYRKVGTRQAQAISKVCFAGMVQMNGDKIEDLRLAWGSVRPTVFRSEKTEQILRGKKLSSQIMIAAGAQLAKDVAPIDDIRSTAGYRTRVAVNLLSEFLRTCGTG